MRFALGIVTLIVLPVVVVTVVMRLLGGGGIAAPLSGAIFTTTPEGAIVNENVRYERKIEVYLDGGPGPNAPQTAAGLPDGNYYFQVTDPAGKALLSQDPAKCREVRVEDGMIVQLVSIGRTYTSGKTTIPCSIQDPPTPPYDPHVIQGVAGPSGRHDTNVDSDHGPPAIVVQLMPFFDTPNPGGVYKAWMVPTTRYVANGGDPDATPQVLKVKGQQVGYRPDPGFGPPRDQVKTDNFKVKEFFPPTITVRKFDDLNGDGVWQKDTEPEVGVDECVSASGAIIPCPGGWPYDFTEPVDGGSVTNLFYTPHTHVAGIPGTYTACEWRLPGWTQTAAYLDGVLHDASQCVSVDVAGVSGEEHEIVFGNFKDVDVEACKFDDKTGNGLTADDTPIEGWTVHLTKNGVVQDTQRTGSNGCYKWENLGPVPGGYYDVGEDVPDGWTPTPVDNAETSHNFESPPQSGASYSFTFTNFKNVEVEACKLKDEDGDPTTTGDQSPIEGWTVHLTKNGVIQDTQRTGSNGCYKWTDLGPVPDGYYDVSEDVPAGWTPLTPTSHNFESPPRSGASYSFTFVNMPPAEGCTPGYWKVEQHWDSWPAPWSPNNPASDMFSGVTNALYATFELTFPEGTGVLMGSATQVQGLHFQGGDTVPEKAEILLRAAVAAVLNADSPGVVFPLTSAQVRDAVNAALASQDATTIINLANQLDDDNNGPGGCPLN